MFMNHLTISLGFFAGMLQFVVAVYALRLNCLFGTARVGWSLFCAFSLLALLHLVQSFTPFNPAASSGGIKVEMMDALVSLLLFVNLVHLETLLKERLRTEIKERQMRAELELDVKKKSAYLLKAIEQLQAEMDERKRLEAEMGSLNPAPPGLFDSFSNMIQKIPATAIVRTLTRESYMLEVDLACHRPLSAAEAGSILIFSHFVGTCGRGAHLPSPVTLPPAQVAFYRRTVRRLVQAGELPAATMQEFEKTFTVPDREPDDLKAILPRLNPPPAAGKRDWFGLNAGQIQPGRVVAVQG
jgi:hypothetical protein